MILVIGLPAAPWVGGAGAQSAAIAFTNVTLIDGTGAAPAAKATVVVSGDRIAAIGRTDDVRVPEGATIVDGTGKFLIPGLWDMHVHSGGYEEGAKLLPRLVGHGITGVRDMASPTDDILRLRRESGDGTLVGPQIIAAGPILQRPLPFTLPPLVRAVTDGDARQIVGELHAKGVDFIKVGDTITRDAYFSIAAESKRLGVPFAGHLPISVTASEATQAGQRSIEHFGSAGFRNVLIACSTQESEFGTYIRDAVTAALAGGAPVEEKLYQAAFMTRLVETYDSRKAAALFESFARNGTWVVPTLRAVRGVWEDQRRQLDETAAAASERVATKTLGMFADMRRAGVKVLAGSDVPFPAGAAPVHDELVALVRAGMTTSQALQAATRNPAEFLGRLSTEGTAEVGKRANLVLLEADPLADIANTRRVAAVVLRGRLIAGTELQRIRRSSEPTRFGFAGAVP